MCIWLPHTLAESRNMFLIFDTCGKTKLKSAWKLYYRLKVRVHVQYTASSHWYHTQRHRKCDRHHRERLVREGVKETSVLLLCTDHSPPDCASLLRLGPIQKSHPNQPSPLLTPPPARPRLPNPQTTSGMRTMHSAAMLERILDAYYTILHAVTIAAGRLQT